MRRAVVQVEAGRYDAALLAGQQGVAKTAGAHVLTITAEPEGPVPKMSDETLVLPAQTMANDQGENVSILPMGSVYEGALFVLFEVIILKLKTSLKITDEVMRSNHTNLE